MGRLFPGILEETFMTDLQDMAIEVVKITTVCKYVAIYVFDVYSCWIYVSTVGYQRYRVGSCHFVCGLGLPRPHR
jgi:hypothetical protein